MSGPTQLCDWNDPGGIPPDVLMRFEMSVDNYVNVQFPDNCDPNCDFGAPCALDQASPAWLVTHGATSSPPPIILYSTTGDHVPNTQADDMLIALRSQFPSLHVEKYKMTYDYGTQHDHAYKYWHAQNNDSTSDGLCVSQEVINFLKTY